MSKSLDKPLLDTDKPCKWIWDINYIILDCLQNLGRNCWSDIKGLELSWGGIEWTNQVRILCFSRKPMRNTPISGFPRAILSLSHAQKRRALESRLMASLVLTLVFAHAHFLNAWSKFWARLLPCRVTRHRRLCQCVLDFLSNLGSVTFSRFLPYYLRTDLINGSCHALENIGSSSALDG